MSDKKLVVITGASSGFGAAAAKLFSQAGHPLLLLARNIEPMQALNLPNAMCEVCDVRDIDAFRQAIAKGEEKFGPVDCLINNAGVMLLHELADQNPKEWDAMIDVNIKGVLNGCQAVLPGMKQRQHGTIMNTSSIAGRKTFPSHVAYCGTKYAVHGLSETLREEVSQENIRVIVIAPGAAETGLLSHTTDESIKSGYEDWKTQMGGVMSADDVARAMLFAYQQPQEVCMREVVLATTKQAP